MNPKVYETAFRIGAKFTGKPAFDQTNKQLTRTQTNAQAASRNIGGMFTALKVGLAGVAGYAGYKAFQKIFEVGQKSIDAAKDVRKAHDTIRAEHARTASLYPKRAMDIEKETQATIELAESMEKAGGIDAEVFGQSLAKLRKYYSAAEVKAMAAGVQDYLVTVEKGAPTEEAAAERIAALNKYIQVGGKEGKIALNMTKEQSAAFDKYVESLGGAERVEARAAAVANVLGKETGATVAWKKTDEGVTYDLAQAQEAWFETAGKSSAEAIPELNKALTNLVVAMEPVAKLIDEQMTPHVKDLTTFLNENKDSFVAWGNNAVWAVDYAIEHINRLQNVFWVFDYLIWYGEQMNKFWDAVSGKNAEPARLPQLPGAPDQAPNPALQEGEAGRRYREAQEKAQTKASATKYMPYQRELDAQVKAAAAAPTAPAPPTPTAPTPTAPIAPAPLSTPAAVQQVSNAQKEQVLREAQNKSIPAAIRHRNPGGMYPGEAARRFGAIGEATIGGGDKIATFPTATHGAAANMWNLANKGYVGKTVGDVMEKWSGGYRGVPGPAGNYAANMRITPEMLKDPNFMVPFMQAVSSGEAPGGHKVLSQQQWQQAFEMYRTGGSAGSLKVLVKEMNLQKAGTASGQSITMNPVNNITVNGVAPGREALMAKKTALALRDPVTEGLRQLRKMMQQDQRIGYA